jgi:phosphoglycerol transferase MdoB-like AlkP superfamily enzyme
VTPTRVGGRSSFWGAQLCVTARLYGRLLSDGVCYCITTYYFQKDVCGTALLSFFLHQLMIYYFKQFNMSTVGNGTAGVSGTGPASRYNLKLSHLFIVFILLLYRLIMNTNNLYTTILLIINNSMIFLLDFEIKIYRKITKHHLKISLTSSRITLYSFLHHALLIPT